MAHKYVIDTSSLINFFRYYYFDQNGSGEISKKLTDFIISKIKSDEIIIIDKVDGELERSPEYASLTKDKEVRSKVASTDINLVLGYVRTLSAKHYIAANEKYYENDQARIQIERDRYENKSADLFLIAECLYIKNDVCEDVTLISDETTNIRGYQKLFPKIPTLCKAEKIPHANLPYLLFEIYKKELKFDLQMAPELPSQTPKP